MPRIARSNAEVVAAEAAYAGGINNRYADMLGVQSALQNRAVMAGVPIEKTYSIQSQVNAYGKPMPPGSENYIGLAQEAINDVAANGPVHTGTYYATPAAAKNLPPGLTQVTSTPQGHNYYADPHNRPIKTAAGVRALNPAALDQALAQYAAIGVPTPAARPELASALVDPATQTPAEQAIQSQLNPALDNAIMTAPEPTAPSMDGMAAALAAQRDYAPPAFDMARMAPAPAAQTLGLADQPAGLAQTGYTVARTDPVDTSSVPGRMASNFTAQTMMDQAMAAANEPQATKGSRLGSISTAGFDPGRFGPTPGSTPATIGMQQATAQASLGGDMPSLSGIVAGLNPTQSGIDGGPNMAGMPAGQQAAVSRAMMDTVGPTGAVAAGTPAAATGAVGNLAPADGGFHSGVMPGAAPAMAQSNMAMGAAAQRDYTAPPAGPSVAAAGYDMNDRAAAADAIADPLGPTTGTMSSYDPATDTISGPVGTLGLNQPTITATAPGLDTKVVKDTPTVASVDDTTDTPAADAVSTEAAATAAAAPATTKAAAPAKGILGQLADARQSLPQHAIFGALLDAITGNDTHAAPGYGINNIGQGYANVQHAYDGSAYAGTQATTTGPNGEANGSVTALGGGYTARTLPSGVTTITGPDGSQMADWSSNNYGPGGSVSGGSFSPSDSGFTDAVGLTK